jgi:hypothetical protein
MRHSLIYYCSFFFSNQFFYHFQLQSLIPKCITALEMLEAFASEREMVASELQELNGKIMKLETEKVERSESRKRFEKVSCGGKLMVLLWVV